MLTNRGFRHFLRFLVFGASTAVICLGVGSALFLLAPGLGFVTINVVSGFVGILVNFTLNYFFNFRGASASDGAKAEFVRFSAVAVTMIALAYLVSAALQAALRLVVADPMILDRSAFARTASQAMVLLLVSVLSFVSHASFSFRGRNA